MTRHPLLQQVSVPPTTDIALPSPCDSARENTPPRRITATCFAWLLLFFMAGATFADTYVATEAQLIAAIAADAPTIVNTGSYALTGNRTIPHNFIGTTGAIITTTGYTLTFSQQPHLPLSQQFAGTGAVVGLTDWYFEYFGAKGDGVTDDSAATSKVATLVGASTSRINLVGKYLTNSIVLNQNWSLQGITVQGVSEAASLIGKSGQTNVLTIENGIGFILRDFIVDYTNLTAAETSCGLYLSGTFGNKVENIWFKGPATPYTSGAYSIGITDGVYTTVFDNLLVPRIKIAGTGSDNPTTLSFNHCDFKKITIDRATAVTIRGGAGQNAVAQGDWGNYRICATNVAGALNIHGADFEDDHTNYSAFYFDNVATVSTSGNSLSYINTTPANQHHLLGGTGITACNQILDDPYRPFCYGTGTWTPSWAWSTPGTSSFTYTGGRGGTWVRNGKVVTASFYLDNVTVTKGTASGSLNLTGLPFTSTNNVNGASYFGGVINTQVGFPAGIAARVQNNDTKVVLVKGDGSGGVLATSDLPNGVYYLRATIIYEVN